MSLFKSFSNMDQQKQQLLEIQLCQQEIVKLDVDLKNQMTAIREIDANYVDQRGLALICKEAKCRLLELTKKVDELDAIAQRVRKPSDKADVIVQVQQHRLEIDQNSQTLKRATLMAMQTLEKASRETLFRHSPSAESATSGGGGVNMRNIQARNLRGQNSEATDTLSRLVLKMGEQVDQSERNITTLVGTSQTIQETGKEFQHMGATIDSSGKLLSKYSRRETTDKILIALALCLFFGVVFYIMKKRMFGGWI